MKPGAFSIRHSVKEIKRSKEFYEKLGFNAIAGSRQVIYRQTLTGM
jgi:predicted lactoylglutathione lyase